MKIKLAPLRILTEFLLAIPIICHYLYHVWIYNRLHNRYDKTSMENWNMKVLFHIKVVLFGVFIIMTKFVLWINKLDLFHPPQSIQLHEEVKFWTVCSWISFKFRSWGTKINLLTAAPLLFCISSYFDVYISCSSSTRHQASEIPLQGSTNNQRLVFIFIKPKESIEMV